MTSDFHQALVSGVPQGLHPEPLLFFQLGFAVFFFYLLLFYEINISKNPSLFTAVTNGR